MSKTENVRTLVDCWRASAGNAGKRASECRQAEMWSKNSAGYAKHALEKRGLKRSSEILSFLYDAGFRTKGSAVLDIGCGPGILSIPLARAGADVTALDIAPGMLEELRNYADTEKIPVHPVECSWWSADIDRLGFRKKFDLVIASATPAVRDVETLERMMACSKKYCYFINSIGGGGHGSALPEISTIIGEEPDRHAHRERGRGHPQGLIYPLLYLYALGYRPLIRFSHLRWERKTSWNEAADRAIGLLEHERNCNAAEKKKIRAYYRTHAKDRKYTTRSEIYDGMLIWKVSDR